MRSKTLSSDAAVRPEKIRKSARVGGWVNGALFRKNLSRFWPLWAAYGVFWIIAVPVIQYLSFSGRAARNSMSTMAMRTDDAVQSLLAAGSDAVVVVSAVAGCLFAMALFSYLYSARSVGLMHAFPIRRESLFLTNYLSGAAVFVSTDAVVTLLTALIWASAGILKGHGALLLTFFLCSAGVMLFFYSFAVFCAMFTGQILALPVFYGILNVLVIGMNQMVQTFVGAFLYGYDSASPAWVEWMTPAVKLFQSLEIDRTAGRYTLSGLSVAGVYAAAGVVLSALALVVYKRRRSETAGDTVSVRWMRPVFRWGMALCVAFVLGQALYFLVFQRNSTDASLPEMLVCMILCGLAGYYGAEMLLKKTFRVFRGSWRGAAVLAVLLVAVGVGTQQDVLGVASRIPAASSVESATVEITGMNHCTAQMTELDGIRQIAGIQREILAEKNAMLQMEKGQSDQGDATTASVHFLYLLKNGGTVSRNYTLYYEQQDLQKDGAVSRLAKLVAQPDVQRQNLLGEIKSGDVRNGELEYLNSNGTSEAVSFDRAAAEEIYKAVERDIEAGHFAKNEFDNQKYQEETYSNTLRLYYETSAADSKNEGLRSTDIQFSTNCTELIAALEKYDVVNAKHPLTKMNYTPTEKG